MGQGSIREGVYRAASASLFTYAASTMFLPVCLLQISEDLSINLAQGGVLGFFSSIQMFLVLLISSFASARFGKIRVLRFSMIVLALGLFIFPLSKTYAAALILILVMGIANGFLEALLTPLVEDLYPKDGGVKMNLLHSFWSLGVFTSVLLVGEFLSRGVSWQWQFRIFALVTLLVSFFYPAQKKIDLPRSRTDFSHIKEIVSLPRFWGLGFGLFFSGGAESAFAFWSATYIQLHYETLPRAGAFGVASFAAGMAIGRMLSSRLAKKVGLKNLILWSLILGLLISLSFFLITNLLTLYGFLFAMGLMIACLWPSIQSYAAQVISVDSTLLMIFLSCFGIPGLSTATLIMGFIGEAKGLDFSFIVGPVYLLGGVICLMIEGRLRGKLKTAKGKHK